MTGGGRVSHSECLFEEEEGGAGGGGGGGGGGEGGALGENHIIVKTIRVVPVLSNGCLWETPSVCTAKATAPKYILEKKHLFALDK